MNKFNEREERIEAMGRECGATAAMRVNEAAEYQAEALPGKEAWQYLQDEAGAVTARERDVFIRGFCDQYYEMVDFQKEEKGWRVKSKSLSAIALVCFLVAGAAGCGDELVTKAITEQDLWDLVYTPCKNICEIYIREIPAECGSVVPVFARGSLSTCMRCAWDGGTTTDNCKARIDDYLKTKTVGANCKEIADANALGRISFFQCRMD